MGVDQYTSTHLFDALEDGGRIELQRDVEDAAGVAQIRAHLQHIAKAFGGGDFSEPAFVHMQSVPGASVMAAKRAAITYRYHELPRGGELRIVTQDPEALHAIHEFMAFQRQEHRAGGRRHHDHERPDHGAVDHNAEPGAMHHGHAEHGAMHRSGGEHERPGPAGGDGA